MEPRILAYIPPIIPMHTFWGFSCLEHIQRQVRAWHSFFKRTIDPDLTNTKWQVTDVFRWDNVISGRWNYGHGFMVRRMDGNDDPMPTGHEWLFLWIPTANDYMYYMIGGSNGMPERFFANTASEAGGITTTNCEYPTFFKYWRVSDYSVEIVGTESLANFVVGDTIYTSTATATTGREGVVYWVDSGDAGHIKVHMKRGGRFQPGETLVDVVGSPTKQIASITTPATDLQSDEVEVVGTGWNFGNPPTFSVGMTVYCDQQPDQVAEVTWIDPADPLHIMMRTTSGTRFNSGNSTVGDSTSSPTVEMSGVTLVDYRMCDIGYEDYTKGQWGTADFMITTLKADYTTPFTVGEEVTTPSGATGEFDSWVAESNMGRSCMRLKNAIGKFKAGETITGTTSGSTAVVRGDSLFELTDGTHSPGAEIYNDVARAYFLYRTENKCFYRMGRQEIYSATVGGGGPVVGDEVRDSTDTKTGFVYEVVSPGRIRILLDSEPFDTTDSVICRSNASKYLSPTLQVTPIELGYGRFYRGNSLYSSGQTTRTIGCDQGNLYNAWSYMARLLKNDIIEFFPKGNDTTVGKDLRGVYDYRTYYALLRTDESLAAYVFDWEDPFIAHYLSWGGVSSPVSIEVLGEIIEPALSTDYKKSGMFYTVLSLAVDNPGFRSHYRLEALFSPASATPGQRTQYYFQLNTNMNNVNTLRSDGKRDWAKVLLSRSDDVKGYIKPSVMRNIGWPGYEQGSLFVDDVETELVFYHSGGYESYPWVKNQPPFPDYALEHMEWLDLVRDPD